MAHYLGVLHMLPDLKHAQERGLIRVEANLDFFYVVEKIYRKSTSSYYTYLGGDIFARVSIRRICFIFPLLRYTT